MRFLSIALIALLSVTQAKAGISYYSNVTNGNNNGTPFTFTFDNTGSSDTWNPLIGTNAAAGIVVSDATDSRITLVGNGQPPGVQTVFGAQEASALDTVASGATVSFTPGSPNEFSINTSPKVARGDAAVVPIPVGGVSDGYFVWATYTTGATPSTYAVGWAKFSSSPRTGLSDSSTVGDTFTISEWAYNLSSSYSSIVVGDTNGGTSDLNFDPGSGSGSVPEPTGLAILGLAATILSCTRKRVR